MKNTTNVTEPFHENIVPSQRFGLRLLLVPALTLLLLDAGQNTAFAGNATWNLNPVDFFWHNPSNWTPRTVPNGASEIATFDVSNTADLRLAASTTVAEIVFNPGASAYTVNLSAYALSINEAVRNNSAIEGSGQVFLGKKNLRVGTNNLNTTFSRVISGSRQGGALIKVGAGKLILSNANRYISGTVVNNGTLVVSNTSGSATGTGAVQVNAGTLGGDGIIGGAVTVGKGSGRGAVLSPGNRRQSSATLTIQNTLTFNADAIYNFSLRSQAGSADDILAMGVTINSGAQFSFIALGHTTLTPGTVYTVINNTTAAPIAGAFSNLPDGSTFNVDGKTSKPITMVETATT